MGRYQISPRFNQQLLAVFQRFLGFDQQVLAQQHFGPHQRIHLVSIQRIALARAGRHVRQQRLINQAVNGTIFLVKTGVQNALVMRQRFARCHIFSTHQHMCNVSTIVSGNFGYATEHHNGTFRPRKQRQRLSTCWHFTQAKTGVALLRDKTTCHTRRQLPAHQRFVWVHPSNFKGFVA